MTLAANCNKLPQTQVCTSVATCGKLQQTLHRSSFTTLVDICHKRLLQYYAAQVWQVAALCHKRMWGKVGTQVAILVHTCDNCPCRVGLTSATVCGKWHACYTCHNLPQLATTVINHSCGTLQQKTCISFVALCHSSPQIVVLCLWHLLLFVVTTEYLEVGRVLGTRGNGNPKYRLGTACWEVCCARCEVGRVMGTRGNSNPKYRLGTGCSDSMS